MSPDKNVFLLLLRLDLNRTAPLGMPREEKEGHLPYMQKGNKYSLIAGLLDPNQQTTSTPLTEISFGENEQKRYNRILTRLEDLLNCYYKKDSGYLADPRTFTDKCSRDVEESVDRIGNAIYDLFPRGTPLVRWLDELFGIRAESQGVRERPERQHVTIITNDFSIPWYWMKAVDDGDLLCEVCALGVQQLTARSLQAPQSPGEQLSHDEGRAYRALLIDGSKREGLPFVAEELEKIGVVLESEDRRARLRSLQFKADRVSDIQGIWKLRQGFEKKHDRRYLYRLVHYSGHWGYSEDSLMVNGERWEAADVGEFVHGAALTLDGCSTAQGLQAWADLKGLTSELLGSGALGCVVSVLPVKNDPIVSDILWGTFYSQIRSGTPTLGQALWKARQTLKEHFQSIGMSTHSWAHYQLIGNPCVHLMPEEMSAES